MISSSPRSSPNTSPRPTLMSAAPSLHAPGATQSAAPASRASTATGSRRNRTRPRTPSAGPPRRTRGPRTPARASRGASRSHIAASDGASRPDRRLQIHTRIPIAAATSPTLRPMSPNPSTPRVSDGRSRTPRPRWRSRARRTCPTPPEPGARGPSAGAAPARGTCIMTCSLMAWPKTPASLVHWYPRYALPHQRVHARVRALHPPERPGRALVREARQRRRVRDDHLVAHEHRLRRVRERAREKLSLLGRHRRLERVEEPARSRSGRARASA